MQTLTLLELTKVQLAHVHEPAPPPPTLEVVESPLTPTPTLRFFEVDLVWLNKELAEVFGFLNDAAFLPLESEAGCCCCCLEVESRLLEKDLARLTEEGSVAVVEGGADGVVTPERLNMNQIIAWKNEQMD